MSARKPLARMETTTVESSEKELINTENTSDVEIKDVTSTEQNEENPEKKIKNDTKGIEIKEEPDSLESSQFGADECSKVKDKNDKPPRSRKQADSTANKLSSPSVAPTNRLTRKAAMKDWAENTRLTRARRTSAGIGNRSETTPNPKRKYVQKVSAAKRKRSISPKPSSEEPFSKIIKTEVSDFDIDTIMIKQEVLESSEEMTSDVASDITDMFPAEPAPRISLRARKTAMCYSPTTRPYRKDKDKMETKETKKKRQSKVRPDEDSKDSMASSTVEEDATDTANIDDTCSKEDTLANGSANKIDEEANSSTKGNIEIKDNSEQETLDSKNDLDDSNISKSVLDTTSLPLSVDTTESQKENILSPNTAPAGTSVKSNSPANSKTYNVSNSPEKSASLSPDLVSEGVCEISVKQFYKKPEFLENNLGIENDPKLGGIVQNVAEGIEENVDQTSLSNESMKEGELVFEEEDEEVASIGTIKNDNEEDEDVNSVSTGFISPLLVEEDEDDENEEQPTLKEEENVVKEEPAGDGTILVAENHQTSEQPKSDSKINETEIEKFGDKKSTLEEVRLKEHKTEEKISKDSIPEVETDITIEKTKIETIKTEKDSKEDMGITKAKIETSTSKLGSRICEKEDENGSVEKIVSLDQNKLEEPADTENLSIENMEVDDDSKPNTNDNDDIKIKTDQEENKENVELKVEAIKPDNMQELETVKSSTDNESSQDEEHIESPSDTSKNSSSVKLDTAHESAGQASSTTPSTSPQSSKSLTNVPRTPENDEKLRQKERHLKTLGLLTHKAADEAIMAKQKRRKFLHNLSNNGSSKKNPTEIIKVTQSGSSTVTTGNGQNKSSQEYTGTLKTIIKINRQSSGNGNGNSNSNNSVSDLKKNKNGDTSSISNKPSTSGYNPSRRQSLKMTFQKGRGRPSNAEKSKENPSNTSGEDSYYTIQNEARSSSTSGQSATVTTSENTSNSLTASTSNQGRKSHNRSNTLNTTDPTPQIEYQENTTNNKKEEKEEILIPEKASSFKFHPGRLCQDQCYYCSGKFGLYDTPCHVGQIKSIERQQKILSNEEKLTVDNCLCDACFRHVDRRANAPTYKKRLSAPGRTETTTASATITNPTETTTTSSTKSIVESNADNTPDQVKSQLVSSNCSAGHVCAVPDCGQKAAHSLRRKNIRKSIKKSLLNFDMSATGTYLYICDKHYEAVIQSSGCVLCKRRLGKNNMYHITTDTDRLEKALADMGIPVIMGQGTAVCKLCRYFANLLMKPPEHGRVQKIEFVKNYRKRLLQFYNVHDKKDALQDEDKSKVKDKDKQAKKNKSSTIVEEPTETVELPPSPTHSTGSSVEMISDGGLFSGDENLTTKKPLSASSKTTNTTPNSASNQMVLDNDVLVDYDVPMISDTSSSESSNSTSPSPQKRDDVKEQQSKLKAILQSVGTSLEDRNDISNALRSNPNISMRELFPGEEDLGLQFKAPFGGRSSQRTPEGWTRVNTFLQYDEPTRRLWEDLQKPYGNQSSFLRHLILLEKYYRNGDLILSSNASSNATVYTQTVRSRLTSFDSRCSSPSSVKEPENRPRSLSVDKIQKQLSSNSVTIIARPKEQPKPVAEAQNAKQKDSNSSVTPLTVSAATAAVLSTPNSRSILKTNVGAIPKGNHSVEIVTVNSATSSKSNSPHSPSRSDSTAPNEGTMLTKQQKILAAANKLMSNKRDTSPNQKKTIFNTTPPELISLNKRPAQSPNTLNQAQQLKRPLLPKPMKPLPPNVVVLPDTLTAQERLESKSWRPTLLPVTTSHHLNNQQGPLYQTADGRRLPALVQVQSGGRPFLISIHDYNRMCILRREKLMRDQMLKGSRGKLKGAAFATSNAGSSNSNSGKQQIATDTTNSALMSFNKTMQSLGIAENAIKKSRPVFNKPTTLYTPIAPKPPQISSPNTLATATITSQTQSHPSVNLSGGSGGGGGLSVKPISLLSSSPAANLSLHQNLSGQNLPILKAGTSTATLSGVPTNSWLWNNFPDPNQMLINGKASSPSTTTATNTKGPQTLFTTMKQQQSLLLDNNLMSKIPKSLTVIPQHKLMPTPPQTAGQSSSSGNITKLKD